MYGYGTGMMVLGGRVTLRDFVVAKKIEELYKKSIN